MSEGFSPDDIHDVLMSQGGEELTVERGVELFEIIYMPARNLAERTRTEYADLHQLTEFLAGEGITKLSQVGLRHLEAFLAFLDGKGLSGVTRHRKTASIRALFQFLYISQLNRTNPARELIPPEREYHEPRFLTTQEYEALRNVAQGNVRDTTIIELILQTGLSLSEVTRLSLDDVELLPYISPVPEHTGVAYVRGKAKKKTRHIVLNYPACKALKSWLRIRPNIAERTLFVSRFRKPLGKRGVEKLVAKYLRAAGITDASVHTLRHTMATQHIVKGTDLETIRDILGHADTKTTSVYLSTAMRAKQQQLQDHAL